MATRAKFKVESVTVREHWQRDKGMLGSVRLTPVIGGSDENDAFYEATPCGAIELGVLNEGVLDQFNPGREFYVDFTPA